jgi:hypothetical protein
MTSAEIIGDILIGVFLLIVGAVSRPLFKKLWEWMNKPSPLSPQTKGQLTTSLAMSENALERLKYLDSHPRDLFLYLVALLFAVLFFSISSVLIYLLPAFHLSSPYEDLRLAVLFLALVLADLFCIFGLVECSRFSEKKIKGQKDRVQKAIDDIKKSLTSPN